VFIFGLKAENVVGRIFFLASMVPLIFREKKWSIVKDTKKTYFVGDFFDLIFRTELISELPLNIENICDCIL
jgi:hypothetical protein